MGWVAHNGLGSTQYENLSFLLKKSTFLLKQVLRMEHAVAENDRTTRETLLQNWRASQRPYGEEKRKVNVFDRNRSNGPRAPMCLKAGPMVGARGFPLRLILSLGAMGWGSGQLQKLFVFRRRRPAPAIFPLTHPPTKLRWVG